MTRQDDAERQYIQAVLAGDFERAEAVFETLPWKVRRVEFDLQRRVVVLEYRHGAGDRLLSILGSEGLKGAWRLRRDSLALIYGFDENLVVNRNCKSDAEAVMRALDLL